MTEPQPPSWSDPTAPTPPTPPGATPEPPAPTAPYPAGPTDASEPPAPPAGSPPPAAWSMNEPTSGQTDVPPPSYPGGADYAQTYQQPDYAPAYAQPGYEQPAGYGQPAYGQPGFATQTTNGLAIASLVCALAGLFTWISAPVGAVLGHVARKQIRERGEQGDGMALAGIIIGWILTGIGLCLCGVWIVAIMAAVNTS